MEYIEKADMRWLAAMKAKKHSPRLDKEGSIDLWVVDMDHHNGPGCETCGWSACMHCESVDMIPECDSPILDLEAVDMTPGMIRLLVGDK